jgi:hypothetical protein
LRVLSASDRPLLDGLLCQKRREFESLLVPRLGLEPGCGEALVGSGNVIPAESVFGM